LVSLMDAVDGSLLQSAYAASWGGEVTLG